MRSCALKALFPRNIQFTSDQLNESFTQKRIGLWQNNINGGLSYEKNTGYTRRPVHNTGRRMPEFAGC